MRVLRSQLKNKDNSRTVAHHVSAQSQQQQVTLRPTPHNTNSTSRNIRRTMSQGVPLSPRCRCDNANATSRQRNMSRRSTFTEPSSLGGSRSDEPQRPSSSRSSTTSSTSTCSSGYATLNQSDQTTLNNDHTTLLPATAQHNLDETSVASPNRRPSSNDLIEQTTTTYEQYHHMRIKFSNVTETVGNINVSVQFEDMSSQWLTDIYRTYEGDLWNKVARLPPTRYCKWYFNCTFCQKQLCHFKSLKTHLNNHLELYPYVCKVCARPYAGRQTLIKHLQSKHDVKSEYGNYIGI